MVRAVLIASLAGCLLGMGCGAPSTSSQEETSSEDTPEFTDINRLTTSGPGAFTVGDIEYEHHCELRIDGRSINNRVRVEEGVSPLDVLMRVTANVFAPFPKEFWIELSTFGQVNHPEHAVHISTTVYVDEKPVKTVKYVEGPDLQTPHRMSFNLFEHTDGVPETVLVRAESDLILYKNTKVSAIDVDNPPEAPADAYGSALSNSLRINFRE